MQNIYACKNSLLIKCYLVSWHQVAFSSRIIIHAIENREAEADPITGIHCNMLQHSSIATCYNVLSAIMYIRGCRSSSSHPFKGHIPASVDLALGEGRLGAV